MTKHHSVLIVGAGIVGACTAFELAQRGVTDILVIDKSDVAGGPTGQSSGILRQFYTHPTLIQMARQGLLAYESCHAVSGGDAGFVRTGWLLTVNAAAEAIARRGLAAQQPLGVPSRWLGLDEVKELIPGMAADDLIGGIYESDSGYGDPAGAATAFLAAARRLGAEYRPRTKMLRWVRNAERITGIETADATFEADFIFNCAGSWVPELVALLGFATPISTSRHQIVTVYEEKRPLRPIVSDPANLVYIRPEGKHLTLIGSNDPADANDLVAVDECPAHADDAKIEWMLQRAAKRLPELGEAGVAHNWSGVYDVSQDGFPILGRLPGVDGMVIATGLSGHGFKLAPAIAEILASFMSGEIDPRAHLFRWNRFQEGEPIRSTTTSSLTSMMHESTG